MEIKIDLTKQGEKANNTITGFKLALVLFVFGGLFTTLIFYSGNLFEGWSLKRFLLTVTHQGLIWVILWMGNGYVSDLVGRKISWTVQPVLRFVITVLTTIVYTVGSMFVFFMLWFRVVWNIPFEKTFQRIDASTFYIALIITVIIALFLHGRSFLISWRTVAVEAEQLKRANIASQFEALKSQVNPHFLFNSLNVLSSLVYKDQDMAAAFIKQMSNVYRYVLEMKNKELVPLEQELEALESYLFLAKIRFGESLNVVIDLPDKHRQIAPLTLQMLVENAIKHNTISTKKPLRIDIGIKEDFIFVRNNLQRKMTAEISTGIGLPNIRDRYRHLSDKAVEIKGTLDMFEVLVPLI